MVFAALCENVLIYNESIPYIDVSCVLTLGHMVNTLVDHEFSKKAWVVRGTFSLLAYPAGLSFTCIPNDTQSSLFLW